MGVADLRGDCTGGAGASAGFATADVTALVLGVGEAADLDDDSEAA